MPVPYDFYIGISSCIFPFCVLGYRGEVITQAKPKNFHKTKSHKHNQTEDAITIMVAIDNDVINVVWR